MATITPDLIMSNTAKILFFASLKEQLSQAELELDVREFSTIADLISHLSERGDNWQKAFANPNLLCAVNQSMCTPEQTISAGDEIAFFPPVTGG